MEDKIKQIEAKIMAHVEESCMLSARPDPDDDASLKREHDLAKVFTCCSRSSYYYLLAVPAAPPAR